MQQDAQRLAVFDAAVPRAYKDAQFCEARMTESLNDWLDTQAVALHGGSAKDPLVDAWLATGRPAEIALAKLHQRGELILAHKATGQPA